MTAPAAPTPAPAIEAPWQWNIIPAIATAAFAEKPDIPLPVWASQNIRLDRRMTTRPGPPEPEEYPWTWEFQEIIRLRHVWEKEISPGVVIMVEPRADGATCMRVHQMDAMKATQTALTEGALNGVRYCAKHDPQNVIFAIDNARQASEVNEIRLQPTLRQLGAEVMPSDEDDAGKFLIKMRRMLIYFLGSYSEGAYAQKMCELGINDELEEHGIKTSVEDMLSRMKSSERRLLVNMSKPKKVMRDSDGNIIGGPIALEHSKGSMHVPEVPCPSCGGFQELLQENMKFDHCKNLLDEWEFGRVLNETFFECIHCRKPIEERWKRWMNDRSRRRWRRTNFKAEPNHISFHISDFYSYDESVRWGRLADKYIRSKGDPVKRQSYRNHHEGLPWEVKVTRVEISDLLLLRGNYQRGIIPWKPAGLILGADVGLYYVKWGIYAFRISQEWGEECAAIDWGKDLHPDDIPKRMTTLSYMCAQDNQRYRVGLGLMDAKYRKTYVHRAAMRLPRRLFPSAGIRSGMSLRSIAMNRPPNRPDWFGVVVYNDDDAKSELYTDRAAAWVDWLKKKQPADEKPLTGRLWFPENVNTADPINGYSGKDFLLEHTRESLEEKNGRLEWKRKGANEGGDLTKVACVKWRYLTLGQPEGDGSESEDTEAEIAAAVGTGEE